MADTQMDGLTLESFSLPVEGIGLSKAQNGDVEPWTIEGLASTASQDQQGEVVLVKGLDLSYFDQGKGTFNWNHFGDKDPSSVVGLIKSHRRTDAGELFVKGILLKNLPKAQGVYNLLKALDAEGETRRMGMSIEGKVLHRQNKVIYKAWVKAIALTMDPVNADTHVNFAKSFAGAEYAEQGDSWMTQVDGATLERALSIASSTAGSVTGGSILTPEALESGAKNIGWAGPDEDEDDAPKHPKKKPHKKKGEKISKGYTKDEAIALVQQLVPRISPDVAAGIVLHAFRAKREG